MARQKKNKSIAPEGFPEKTWNKLSTTWRDAAQSKQTEELEQEIIKSVRSIADQSAFMKNDEKLAALQEELKYLKSSYTDSITAEKAKVDFCVFLFNTRGTKVSQSTQNVVDDANKEENGN
jgi:hypothetical protein